MILIYGCLSIKDCHVAPFPAIRFLPQASEKSRLGTQCIIFLNSECGKSKFKMNSICLSVDVEEYFHAANLAEVCPIREWHTLPSRVKETTSKLLDIFDITNSKGTFFILGYTARSCPEIVKEIKNRGHEIASHGFAHKIAYFQNHKQFLRDVSKAKKLLEDISGSKIHGYRAPNFSITDKNIWAYECLVQAGYSYDSSLYPVHHDRYGNPHRKSTPENRNIDGESLTILPLAVLTSSLLNLKVPIAGGAYWRLLPRSAINLALSSAIRQASTLGIKPICYLHPWEIDTQQPYFPNLSASKKIRHYFGVRGFENKIRLILERFGSVTIANGYEKIIGKAN